MAQRRKSRMRERVKRHAHNAQKGGGNSLLLLPESLELFKPEEEDDYTIDVLPYVLTNKNHPDGLIDNEPLEEGEVWYRRPYGIHFNVGGTKKRVICPSYTFGEKCPICEDVDKLSKDYEENVELIKAIRVKKNCLFVVLIDGIKKFRLFDWSYAKFAEVLEKEIDRSKDNSVAGFAELQGGKTLTVRIIQESFMGKPFLKADRVDFTERKNLPESILDKIPSLDDCFRVMTYDEISELHLGNVEVEGALDSASSFKSNTAPKDDVDVAKDETPWEEEEEKEEKKAPPKKRSRKTAEPKEEEEEEKEKPKRTRKPAKKEPIEKEEQVDEDDGWDMDEEVEEKEEKKAPPKKAPKKKVAPPKEEEEESSEDGDDDDDWGVDDDWDD